jgi:hypothetical protein
MESEHGITMDRGVPGPPIIYEGEYDFATESLLGIWYFGPHQVWFPHGGQLRGMQFPASRGRWRMSRSAG